MSSVDKDRICTMYETGYFTQEKIAKRLRCSLKSVQRAIAEQGAKPDQFQLDVIDTEDEIEAIFAYYSQGMLVNEIAYRFGLSDTAIWNKVFELESMRAPR